MLINCPRCGFSQPNDKYCAQCGVDMETYRPAQVSLIKKILGSPILQFGAIFLLAAAAAFFLYHRDQANLQARVSYLKGSAPISVAEGQNAKNLMETASAEPPSASAGLDKAVAAADAPSLADKKPDDTPAPAAKALVAKPIGPVIRVFYAEVSRPALQRIFEESQSTGQFMTFKDDYSAGIIPNIDQKLSPSNTNIKILHKEERPVEMGKSLQWFYGLKDRQDPDTDLGMTTFIEMSEIEAGNYRGNLEIQRSWRETMEAGKPATIQHRSFPAIFEIGSSTGFFISGVMPYKTNLDNDDDLTSIDIFKILKSDDFQRKSSDFVIFVELDPK
jgi:hypothetical protein